MDKRLMEEVQAAKDRLANSGIFLAGEKQINYGYQLSLEGDHGSVAIYNGKKGLRYVIRSRSSDWQDQLETLLLCGSTAPSETAVPLGECRPFPICRSLPIASSADRGNAATPNDVSCWMGCDESGKGDVFGPLVTAACMVTPDTAAILARSGICDSKLLAEGQIIEKAAIIKETIPGAYVINILAPEDYNELYHKIKLRHENLNHLLGEAHGTNIKALLERQDCSYIIVDKFGKDEYVLNALGDIPIDHQIVQITKGERNVAVAAASILARAAFVKEMAALSNRYKMVLPKGAYYGVAAAIDRFITVFGASNLNQVGKLNFKTFDKYRGYMKK